MGPLPAGFAGGPRPARRRPTRPNILPAIVASQKSGPARGSTGLKKMTRLVSIFPGTRARPGTPRTKKAALCGRPWFSSRIGEDSPRLAHVHLEVAQVDAAVV